MTLDPQAKAVLDLTASAIANGAPPMWETTPVEARAAYRTMTTMMGAKEDVHSVDDQTIPGPAGELPIRIYRPEPGNRAALVFYHGGGFVIGDLETHDRENRMLANRSGVTIVSVDYRLAPEHPFPAALDDAWHALVWVREHAAELDVDHTRLAVGGDSAGGNLAAVTALRAAQEGVDLAGQVLIYPAVDISEGVDDRYPSRSSNDGYVLSTELNQWFIQAYVGSDGIPVDDRLTPINAPSHERLAPAFVLIAGYDPLRDEGEAYAKRLQDAGVSTTLRCFDGQIHGFFNLSSFIDDARTAVDEVADFLRLQLAAPAS